MSPEAANDKREAVETAALKLLSGREHSRQELQRKLKTRFGREAIVDEVLDGLESSDLLSEQRFIEGYIDQRCRKGFGPLRIRAELAERGIAADRVEEALETVGPDWEGLLQRAAERKFGDASAADRREEARRGRFLEQRGFPVGLIRRYLDAAGRD